MRGNPTAARNFWPAGGVLDGMNLVVAVSLLEGVLLAGAFLSALAIAATCALGVFVWLAGRGRDRRVGRG